jgi:hypothetical protein
MKKLMLLEIVLLLPALAPMANASVVTVSFDELNIGEDVLEYYNGGNGGDGTGPGPDFDISFSSGWIAGPPDVYWDSSSGNSVEISGLGFINMHSGWSGMTSFYYSGGDLVVDFYDQERGLGNQVGTWILPGQTDFSAWGEAVPLFFSAVFNSSGGNRIDALTSGAAVVPEPASLMLFGIGLGVIGLAAWRRRE